MFQLNYWGELEKYKYPVQGDSVDKTQIEAIRSAEMNLLVDFLMVKIHREIISCTFTSKKSFVLLAVHYK